MLENYKTEWYEEMKQITIGLNPKQSLYKCKEIPFMPDNWNLFSLPATSPVQVGENPALQQKIFQGIGGAASGQDKVSQRICTAQ